MQEEEPLFIASGSLALLCKREVGTFAQKLRFKSCKAPLTLNAHIRLAAVQVLARQNALSTVQL